jgi:hypothetical protein
VELRERNLLSQRRSLWPVVVTFATVIHDPSPHDVQGSFLQIYARERASDSRTPLNENHQGVFGKVISLRLRNPICSGVRISP